VVSVETWRLPGTWLAAGAWAWTGAGRTAGPPGVTAPARGACPTTDEMSPATLDAVCDARETIGAVAWDTELPMFDGPTTAA
jgi:hypothetical protein